MKRSSLCARLLALSLLVPWLSPGALAGDGDAPPTRVVVILSSSDHVIADLEHMVVDLAQKPGEWEKNVLPNIEIFLYGVDRALPVRMDQMFDSQGGQREQWMVPISNLKAFIEDNLDPIGIIVKQDRKQKDLYSLKDVYNGWMRVKNNYALFALKDFPDDVGANLPDPRKGSAPLLARGYDVAAHLANSSTTPEQRIAAFAAFRDNTLAGVEKRPDESKEAFALRRTNSEQSLETMQRLFVESSEVIIGWTTDTDKHEGRGELSLTPVGGTSLETTIQALAAQPSQFQQVPVPANAVLTGRMNVALDETMTRQFAEIFKLSRPVTAQKIDETAGITDEQKSARKQIAEIILDLLDGSLGTGAWSGVLDVVPHDGGKHTGLVAVRTADSSPLTEALELLPKSGGYKSELNVDQAGEVAIHKVTVTENYPNAFKKFFGESAEIYVGTGKDALWLSVGDGALEAMKAGVAAAAQGPGDETPPTVAELKLHLSPVLQVMSQLRKDGDFDLMAKLKGGQTPQDQASTDPAAEPAPGSETLRMLEDFEWRDTAVEALEGTDDVLEMKLDRVENRVEGKVNVHQGILKAIGELIAKFAKENLA